jgi:LPXTG-site transpeptidase (sortase) family protein
MNNTHTQNGPVSVFQRISTRKYSFLAVFILVGLVTVSICSATGFIPNPPAAASSTPATTTTEPMLTLGTSPLIASADTSGAIPANLVNMAGELPTQIKIASIGLSTTVSNPDTTDVEALDSYLLKGAARYPSSATLGQEGNMILFGHSSYLPIVNNKAFKSFNGIQNLKAGDQIEVYSAQHKFVYAVQTVQKMDANSDGIALTNKGYTLTLATCDSFTKKTDRFVVTATLVGSYPLGS